jgi:HPt (histidine-containing phosphotransfer) domain-containing protein
MIPAALRERFLSGLQQRVDEMHAALATGDVQTLARQLHSLAGIGGTYGFMEVTELARKAERLAQRGRFRAVERIVSALERVREQAA